MPTEDHMTLDERRKYLKLMLPRYVRADYPERGRLLDEMEVVTELHRKSLLRLLGAETLSRQPRQKQRGRMYDHTVDDALRLMAETLDYICAERLQPVLPWLAQNAKALRRAALGVKLSSNAGFNKLVKSSARHVRKA